MTTFRTYQTREGDRFDLIAWQQYRDPYGYERLITANPELRNLQTLPGGIALRVAVVTSAAPTIPPEQLPPWKR